ncbi:hypothetical protein L484_022999 [Morus notabilis]|uniref:Uncharacterized protein n=1 Tax=Morus notabilis TaxID=981085 RepID=W9S9D5_9ROSA|nr:hypothetical protein L484_022999 [Morus notabilis]
MTWPVSEGGGRRDESCVGRLSHVAGHSSFANDRDITCTVVAKNLVTRQDTFSITIKYLRYHNRAPSIAQYTIGTGGLPLVS